MLAILASSSGRLNAAIIKGPYLQNVTQTAVTVCWASDVDEAGAVGITAVSGGTAISGKDKEATRLHKVRVVGLSPNTHYNYTVACGADKASGTFPSAVTADKPFRFVAYGDNRGDPTVHASILAGMLKFDPAFVINSGDIVANGEDEALWTEFFHTAAKMLSQSPFFPCLGNHERSGAAYLRYFDYAREYSFDYGNVHFATIDTNQPVSEYAAQDEWLKKDLADHQSATWRVVFFHHTPFTCVTKDGRREAAEKLRARLEPILKAGNVQLVINGHDHDYQHHLASGINYLVSGGGGAPLYEVIADTPFVKFAKMVHHYCEISVDGAKMHVRAVEADGKLVDEFDLKAGG